MAPGTHFIGNLILDNHSSQLDIEVAKLVKENNMALLGFSPHCSLLEYGVYGPFKNYCACQQDAWLRNNIGKAMYIHDIPFIENKAFPLALNPANIINWFRNTSGISLYIFRTMASCLLLLLTKQKTTWLSHTSEIPMLQEAD